MNYRTKVQPPDHVNYLNRCNELRAALRQAETVPPVFIVVQCFCVLRSALGSKWRILGWIVRDLHDNLITGSKSSLCRVWWQRVMRLSDEEIERKVNDRIFNATAIRP